MTDKGSTVNLREKLGTLIKKFIRYMDDNKRNIFQISTLLQQANNIIKDQKRSLQVIFYLQGLGITTRITQNHVVFVGLRGMTRKLYQFQTDSASAKISANLQMNILGKQVLVKSYILGGDLLSSIFYQIIYDRQTIPKSSIQDAVQSFMLQQKDLNSKNFVQQSLNMLSYLGLIQKDQSTQVISYVGPDLRCYDQNGKKTTQKIYQLLMAQKQIFGRETQQIQTLNKLKINNKNLPQPKFLSHFPQLSYAVLRSSNWQKHIKKTVYFIGRQQKHQNSINNHSKPQIDLQLPQQSVSRQHAVILYNKLANKWQIRCLSRKNMIKVDDQRIAYGDRNVWIKNRSEITIGDQKFVFLQANTNKSNQSN